MLNSVFTEFEHMAEEKGIYFKMKLNPLIDDTLSGDPLRIRQVLTNLVNNAIKFTSDGGVLLECELIEKKGDWNSIRFQVRDTGIGINQGNLEKIFQSFQQEDESVSRKFGGTGLGLAISKQLVELMGGNILVESIPGEGSTFSFKLDLESRPASSLEDKQDEIVISPHALSGKRILVAEDNQFNQFITQSMLEKWGASVECAENGSIALEMMKKKSYDLILMDMQMPVMDGIETTRIIRRKLKSEVPIIALTANVLKEVIKSCMEAGMNEFIAKPFEPASLYRKITGYLPVSIDLKVAKEAKEDQKESKAGQELYDFSRLNRMFAEDVKQVKIMVDKFLEITPEYMSELNQALREKRIDAVEKMAHKLKASIDLIARDELRSNIRNIHELARNREPIEKLIPQVEKFTESFDRLIRQLHDLS
jgi:CheY-like chemotaxis protein